MNAQELKDRTKHFALRVMHLVDALPETPKGRAVASQLVRSGMSVAANYRAACRARSHAEFISKIGIVEEEADESTFWLDIIPDTKNGSKEMVAPLLGEARELTAIFTAAGKTAKLHKQDKICQFPIPIRIGTKISK